MSAILRVENIETAYGESQVLFGVSFEIEAGKVATLLGRNGMGKTTTVRSILGLNRIKAGRIFFNGVQIDRLTADQVARMGVAIVPEGRQIFPNLSVKENLIAFAANRCASKQPWTLDRVYALFPRLQERAHNMGNQLSGGEQQMLAIGRALMTNPHLLILDEATEGLAPLVREEIWRCLAELRAMGQTTLIIDKYVQRLIELADQHTVIERGKLVWSGDSEALRQAPDIWHRYIGV
ncbi:ABC transporter ATP-binding protein [Noviherbaspirillum cavernae]|uniref:ABC transporter ATP-binding protein n=1 Tax=Noviherbaspirillum cavernae TaxID=2320862 RepID=A0A418X2K0_9BURK|nr:ABC transporter ATP-binding protein [Noviherbaspirillum cavernae]RJG06676.1 ABC transporter ATP-binding protein [Noviherbaspirillum cavernae]